MPVVSTKVIIRSTMALVLGRPTNSGQAKCAVVQDAYLFTPERRESKRCHIAPAMTMSHAAATAIEPVYAPFISNVSGVAKPSSGSRKHRNFAELGELGILESLFSEKSAEYNLFSSSMATYVRTITAAP